MKKIIIACGVALMAATTLVGCGGSSASGSDGFGDSLSTAFGSMYGSQLNNEFAGLPDEQKAKLNKEDILRGFKEVIMLDTTQSGYLTGLSIGMNFAGQLQQFEQAGIKVDRKGFYDAFAAAFKQDSISPAAFEKTNSEYQALQGRLQEIMMKEMMRQQEEAEAARANDPAVKKTIEEGKKYVADQKKADAEIKTTPSGLSYKVVKEGTGTKPTASDNVKVKYVGKHINGEEFDSSKGEAVSFNVGGVVPGFSEALQMMTPGSKYILYIPAELGYGTAGSGPVAPGETLVFEVELVGVDQPAPAEQKVQ